MLLNAKTQDGLEVHFFQQLKAQLRFSSHGKLL